MIDFDGIYLLNVIAVDIKAVYVLAKLRAKNFESVM